MSTTIRNILVLLGMVVAIAIGFAVYVAYGNPSHQPIELFEGKRPKLADVDIEHVPSVSLLNTVGWGAGEAPVPAAGLAVSRWAEGLQHPRTMLTLPNGDVLVAETAAPDSGSWKGVTGFFAKMFMSRVGAAEASPNAVILLRGAEGADKAGERHVLLTADLASPSGMAWTNDTLYVANHNAVLAFPYKLGDLAVTGKSRKIMDLPGGGNHWMRNLLLSEDGKQLFVAVGSSSNIGDNGMAAEKGRAAIYQIDLASGHPRQYAAGLRNPNGMAWNPATGELWTVVNERDMLGPDLVPDYLTNVPVGAHYGWPWVYWKDVIDPRVDAPMPDYLTDYSRKPEYALGPHVAALGLVFTHGGERMGANFANGAFIARHGSWNRKPPVGYDVVFVPFDAHGNPQGKPVPVLTGFMTGNGSTHGRPTWVTWAKDGTLLVSDDTAGIIWRVSAPGAAPSQGIKPVVTAHLPPQRSLDSEATIKYGAKFGEDEKVRQ
ncbi:MAG: sorbosone dehydrogenase family protein [Sphingomonadales bacterium]|nr:sorbosone dehydrogenase family protein [Sphingomonadales bacterium]